jgi:hypothetical protein
LPSSNSTSYEALIGSMASIRAALAVDCEAANLAQILDVWMRPDVLPAVVRPLSQL